MLQQPRFCAACGASPCACVTQLPRLLPTLQRPQLWRYRCCCRKVQIRDCWTQSWCAGAAEVAAAALCHAAAEASVGILLGSWAAGCSWGEA